jgi:hypothetical protein
MSGPKSYSIHVFDKHLKQIFVHYAEIETLFDLLAKKTITDDLRGVKYQGEAFVDEMKTRLNQLLENLKPTGNETLNQSQFNVFYNKFYEISQQILLIKIELENEITHFNNLETSYQAFLNIELTLKDYLENFETIKVQFLEHVKQNNPDSSKLIDFAEQLHKIRLNLSLPAFSEDFSLNAGLLKRQFGEILEHGKEQINTLFKQFFGSEKIRLPVQKVFLVNGNQNLAFNEGNKPEYVEKIQATVKELLGGIAEPSQHQYFSKKYSGLLQHHKISEVYFFVEFIDEIEEQQKQEGFKTTLRSLLAEIDLHVFEKSQEDEAAQFSMKINQLIEHDRIKKEDVINATSSWHKVIENNRLARLERLKHEAGQKFIKQRLIAGLQDLNYEVMTDMEVIDFEHGDVFLLSVPDQDNFINLRFDSNGRMLYNFLIPENRAELTHEQKEIRLAELDETCTGFRKMLEQLKREGLKIDLENEIKATEKALVQLPPKFKALTKKADVKKSKKDVSGNRKFLE